MQPTGRIDVAGSSYSSTDPQDPVREAITVGRTVASNGPLGIVQVDGTLPGDTAEHDRTKPLKVRVDWNRSSFRTFKEQKDSDGIITSTSQRWIDEDPEVVRIVVGPTDSDCGSDRSACAALTETETVYLTAADKRRGYIVRAMEPSSSTAWGPQRSPLRNATGTTATSRVAITTSTGRSAAPSTSFSTVAPPSQTPVVTAKCCRPTSTDPPNWSRSRSPCASGRVRTTPST